MTSGRFPLSISLVRLGGVVTLPALLLCSALTLAHEADGHPARIHEGTCDALGAVAFPLTGVGAEVTTTGTPVPEPAVLGSSDAVPLDVSETEIDASLTDLTKSDFAIAVYESDEAMDTVLVCGNIGGPVSAQMAGMVMPGDDLAVWLPAAGDSADAGLALIRAAGTKATVRIYLAEP